MYYAHVRKEDNTYAIERSCVRQEYVYCYVQIVRMSSFMKICRLARPVP